MPKKTFATKEIEEAHKIALARVRAQLHDLESNVNQGDLNTGNITYEHVGSLNHILHKLVDLNEDFQ